MKQLDSQGDGSDDKGKGQLRCTYPQRVLKGGEKLDAASDTVSASVKPGLV